MTIELPDSRKEINDRMKNDVRAQLPQSNPFLRNSFLGALVFGISGRIFDFFLQIKALLREIFMDTATGEFLERWGSYVNVFRKAATIAEGPITIGGTLDSVIPLGTDFQSSDGALYSSDTAAQVISLDRAITNDPAMSRLGQVVTATTTTPHVFASGISVTISGADQPEYNGLFPITATGDTTFEYTIVGAPITPATGTIKSAFTGASVSLESQDFGQVANHDSGAALTLTTPIAGVDNGGFVQFSTISGGEDLESDDDLRDRIIDRYQNPVSFFNVAQIEQKVKTVAGVTRVFVQEITPEPGDVTIFFTKDNDVSIIPTLEDRRLAKAAVLEIKPANISAGTPSDPTGLDDPKDGDIKFPVLRDKEVIFIFTELKPDNSSLRAAIVANLDQLFRQDNPVGLPIAEILYQCAIFESFDDAGNKVQDFELSSPVGNIAVDSDQIATFSSEDIVFPA